MFIKALSNARADRLVRRFWLSVAALSPLVPLAEAAAEAQLFVHPTLIMLSGTERTATLHLVNQGDARGVFELQWVDYAMTSEGGLSERDDAPWSLQPYVRFSPRRVTLGPGETQLVRVALRAGGDVAEGEYYSHLKAVTLEDDLDALETSDDSESSEAEVLMIEARTAIAIPLIWRNSTAAPRASIEFAQLDSAGQAVTLGVRRAGGLSTRGYLHVLGRRADSAQRALAEPVPLVIYPSLDRRTVTIPLSADAIRTVLLEGAEVVYSPDIELDRTSPPYAARPITR